VNAEQASKRCDAEADPAEFRGRPSPLGRIHRINPFFSQRRIEAWVMGNSVVAVAIRMK